MRRRPRPPVLAAIATTAVLSLAACGGDEEAAAPADPAAQARAAVATLKADGYERSRVAAVQGLDPAPDARLVVAGRRSAGDLEVLVYRDAATARAGLAASRRTPQGEAFVSLPSAVVGGRAYRARGPESDQAFRRDVGVVERALAD